MFMPKKNNPADFQDILDVLKAFSNGASLKEIESKIKRGVSKRTLQRRLSKLIERQLISVEGKTKARIYKLVKENLNNEAIEGKKISYNEIIKLSAKSIEIQKKIAKPIQLRKYVNYNRKFLDKYKPNISSYLSESVKKHLKKIGKTDGERPAGTYAKQIFNRLLIDLSWNSSRLEGNTYSLLETERLFEFSEVAEGKNLFDSQMILNHKSAIEFLVNTKSGVGINKFSILSLHALLSENLLGNPDSCGRLRNIPVGIAKAVYQPTAIIQLIEECFDLIIKKAHEILDPFEKSFFLMVHIPYLQPFEDVNKRVSRLAANIPLIIENLCPLSFIDVPQDTYINGLLGVYELNKVDLLRDVFIWSYERSSQFYSTVRKTLGEPDPFRFKYRDLIHKIVSKIVLQKMNKSKSIEFIRKEACKQFKIVEIQNHFIDTIEVEFRGLHIGNIARYKLKQSDFNSWKKIW
jgi:hypothetical protein